MKKTLAIMSAMLLTLSCHNSPRHAGSVRGMEDIFEETVKAVLDTTSDYSVDKAEALLNELADTLCSVMENTALEDVVPRMEAQEIAGHAVFLAADYASLKGIEISPFISKFSKVMSIWRIRPTGDSVDYLKEIPYNIRQDTDDEAGREMYIIAKTDPDKPTIILLPQEATEGALVLFAHKIDGEGGYDVENAMVLNGDDGEDDGDFMVYRFDSGEFMEALKTFDALFVMYFEKGGIHESAMVRLEDLQTLMSHQE